MPSGPTSTGGGSPRGASSTLGRILALVGLVVCIPAGLYLVSIAVDALGIVLGVVGYFLGARALGTITVILGLLAIIFGLLTQGYPVGPGA